jgi:hypothetical protein
MTFAGLRLEDQKSPNMLAYNGDLVVHVVGSDRAIAPYVVSGVGGLTLFTRREVTNLGIVNDETYFTGNVGGGVKWFATQHVGLRGDGRFIMVKSRDEVPFFSQEKNQYGARAHAGVLLTLRRFLSRPRHDDMRRSKRVCVVTGGRRRERQGSIASSTAS